MEESKESKMFFIDDEGCVKAVDELGFVLGSFVPELNCWVKAFKSFQASPFTSKPLTNEEMLSRTNGVKPYFWR